MKISPDKTNFTQVRRKIMHKAVAVTLIVIFIMAFLAAPVPSAGQGPPLGACPQGFELRHFMEHEDHHDHHIGLAQDLNQDGMICIMDLSNGLHVHMDNVLP
jgi:hypothetical protein